MSHVPSLVVSANKTAAQPFSLIFESHSGKPLDPPRIAGIFCLMGKSFPFGSPVTGWPNYKHSFDFY